MSRKKFKLPNYSFLKINFPYILVTFFYGFLTWVVLGMSLLSLVAVFTIYCITILFAFLLPTGEALLRFIMNVRRPMTKREKDYLIPLFLHVRDVVYKTKVRDANTTYVDETEIYISDSMSINAFCFGEKTIVVTRGAILAFNENQLKGVIAHEFGHLVHGNTKALLFTKIGNGIFSIAFLPISLIVRLIERGIKFLDSDNPFKFNPTLWFLNILKTIVNAISLSFNFISGIILSANSRYCEHLADSYAFDIGFGEYLTEALYLLYDLSLSSEIRISKRLLQSHPNIAKRIERLEEYHVVYKPKRTEPFTVSWEGKSYKNRITDSFIDSSDDSNNSMTASLLDNSAFSLSDILFGDENK